MQYPCILYKWDDTEDLFADNTLYRSTRRYLVTVIDADPDSDIPNRVKALPLCRTDRIFVAENLNHFTFNLFF